MGGWTTRGLVWQVSKWRGGVRFLRSAMVMMMGGCRREGMCPGIIIIVIVGMFILLLPDGVLTHAKGGGWIVDRINIILCL